MTTTTRAPRRILVVVGVALVVMVLNVVASILYMVVYGHVLAPGHDDAFYQAHVRVAGPISSVIVGIPLVYYASRWLARRRAAIDGIGIAIAYFVIDTAILLVAGGLGVFAPIVALSHATKLAAAFAGARA